MQEKDISQSDEAQIRELLNLQAELVKRQKELLDLYDAARDIRRLLEFRTQELLDNARPEDKGEK